MSELRERGVYELPDGRRYVAESDIFGGHNLYEVGGPAEVAAYRVNWRGEVLDAVTLVVVFPPGSLTDAGAGKGREHPRKRRRKKLR